MAGRHPRGARVFRQRPHHRRGAGTRQESAERLTDAGRELRVVNGDNPNDLYDSLLSRTGDEPLEVRADGLRAVLLDQGWVGDE